MVSGAGSAPVLGSPEGIVVGVVLLLVIVGVIIWKGVL